MIVIPERQLGQWKIEHFVVTPEAAKFESLRSVVTGCRRAVPAGNYMALKRGDHTIMSNTPDELRDLWTLKWNAKGHVLIAGLGLGCAVEMCLGVSSVDRITVIEIDPDVIELVAPSMNRLSDRIEIIHADIFEWKPPAIRYGAAWFDIWDAICSDNLEQMKRLHRHYGRRADWKGSWCRAECEEAKRRWRP